jgi:hypothetical protein
MDGSGVRIIESLMNDLIKLMLTPHYRRNAHNDDIQEN